MVIVIKRQSMKRELIQWMFGLIQVPIFNVARDFVHYCITQMLFGTSQLCLLHPFKLSPCTTIEGNYACERMYSHYLIFRPNTVFLIEQMLLIWVSPL